MKYEAKEVQTMDVVVHHRVMDRENSSQLTPGTSREMRRLVYRCVAG
jgi:hypothetical protein